MKKIHLFFFFLLPVSGYTQIKPSKLAGTYYGRLPDRLDFKTHKPTYNPNGDVKLIVQKNHKCMYKTSMFSSKGTWEISTDSVLTCTFVNEFGDKKSKEESVDAKKYRVDKNFTLIPVQAHTSKLFKR
jgi:hypothetical protein